VRPRPHHDEGQYRPPYDSRIAIVCQAIDDRWTIDALLRMKLNAPLSTYALIDLPDVLEGMKRAGRLVANLPLETPDDWLANQVAGKHG
jgi:hypothetical protein